MLEVAPHRAEQYLRSQHGRHRGATPRRVRGFYNCFGLAFGGRRTWIADEDKEIEQILRTDHYHKISIEEIVEGDLILYTFPSGAYSHVAVVLAPGLEVQRRSARVLSKWGQGAEFVHDMYDLDDEMGQPTEFWTDREVHYYGNGQSRPFATPD